MDQATVSDIPQKIKDVELKLAIRLLDKIKDGSVPFKEAQRIARFVLRGVEEIADDKGFVEFLKELADKWEMFADIYKVERIKFEEVTETEDKMKEIQNQLLKFSQKSL